MPGEYILDLPICPWCRDKNKDWWVGISAPPKNERSPLYDKDGVIVHCYTCKEEYIVTKSFETYHTKKIEKLKQKGE